MTKVFIKVTNSYTAKNKLQKCILDELTKLECILCNNKKEATKLITDAFDNALWEYEGRATVPSLKHFNLSKDTLTYHVDEVIQICIYNVRGDYTLKDFVST